MGLFIGAFFIGKRIRAVKLSEATALKEKRAIVQAQNNSHIDTVYRCKDQGDF